MTKGSPVTKDECIEALREAKKELGHSPSRNEYEELGIGPSPAAMYNRFGGWNAAKEVAGLDQVGAGGKLSVNSNYFDQIDSPEKAYWLGLLWADGSINNRRVMIGLKDRELIAEFRDALDSEHSIGKSAEEEFYRISISDPQIVESLNFLGFTQEKTYDDSLPQLESEELQRAFIRGMFDGDGHVDQGGRFNITGSSKERFWKLTEWIPYSVYINNRGDGAYTLRVAMSKSEKMLDWIYPEGSNTEPKLERKYNTWMKKLR